MDVFKYSAQADTNLVAANGTFKGFFCYRHTRAMDAGTLETKPEFWLRLLSSICQDSVKRTATESAFKCRDILNANELPPLRPIVVSSGVYSVAIISSSDAFAKRRPHLQTAHPFDAHLSFRLTYDTFSLYHFLLLSLPPKCRWLSVELASSPSTMF